MSTVLLVAGAVIIALAVSALTRRSATTGRRAAAATEQDHHIPDVVSASDFGIPEDQWMLVVFSSDKCATCAVVVEAVSRIDMPDLTVAVVGIERMPGLHAEYRIDAVPTTIVADPTGSVRKSFLGPVDLPMIELAVSAAKTERGSGNS